MSTSKTFQTHIIDEFNGCNQHILSRSWSGSHYKLLNTFLNTKGPKQLWLYIIIETIIVDLPGPLESM